MKLINHSSTNLVDLAPGKPGAEVKVGDTIIGEDGICWLVVGFGVGGRYGQNVQVVDTDKLQTILEFVRPSTLDLSIELEN